MKVESSLQVDIEGVAAKISIYIYLPKAHLWSSARAYICNRLVLIYVRSSYLVRTLRLSLSFSYLQVNLLI